MGNIFQFKQFSVNQEHCAMRINTDGVLLGAFAEQEQANAILDIGTGTGVIALMLAQKYPQAQIWAVEIDKLASQRAAENFQASPFQDRLSIVHSDIFHWKTDLEFDLIVSNPPFYINSLHNPDQRKKVAKHTDVEFFKGMFHFAAGRLSSMGKLQIVVPIELLDFMVAEAKENQLFLNKQINMQSFVDSEPFRCILSFQREEINPQQQTFVIYQERSQYSEAYKQILQPYFLAF
ncbi:tRNA1(Val) (adenine(37)-N6)-methyltransferase [Sphingobacterium mizutaii]|uniref:tRNA1(Val) (adenine(37)-N6)-methyltransferase n=1 Tax=Sphingobacterium mizutaii TaxID=1010 RepID=UPI0028A6F24D|nr:methyltransferase [Sphingobacterium mizutaii]